MRAILFVILGGALLWVVWENSGLARARSTTDVHDAPGVLVPVSSSAADVPAAALGQPVDASGSLETQTPPTPCPAAARIEQSAATEPATVPQTADRALEPFGRQADRLRELSTFVAGRSW